MGCVNICGVCVCLCVSSHLRVPVGEGMGESNALMCSSCCCMVGMLILRGEIWGRRGRRGGEGSSRSLCSSASRSDINWILMTVLGKRNTHLATGAAKDGDGGRHCGKTRRENKKERVVNILDDVRDDVTLYYTDY